MNCLNKVPKMDETSKGRPGYTEAIDFFQPHSFLSGNIIHEQQGYQEVDIDRGHTPDPSVHRW